MAKANKKRVWVDYDDDLFTVPVGNPAFKIYGEPEVQQNVRKCMAMADLVTVSTEKLRGIAYQYNPNTHVIRNAYNEFIFGRRPEPMKDRRKLVVWRGSATHDADLAYLMPEITSLVERFKDWTFCFIGEPFWQLKRILPEKQALFVKSVDQMEYWEMLGQIQPAVMMVPLEPNAFNESKSCIAHIEGSYGGAVTVAPHWEEWKLPGVLPYRDKQTFVYQMVRCMEGREDLVARNSEAWEYIERELCVSKANKKRYDLLTDCLMNRPTRSLQDAMEALKRSS